MQVAEQSLTNEQVEKYSISSMLCPQISCPGKMEIRNNPTKNYLYCPKCETIAKTLGQWDEKLELSCENVWAESLRVLNKIFTEKGLNTIK